jgi:hypothetical protein
VENEYLFIVLEMRVEAVHWPRLQHVMDTTVLALAALSNAAQIEMILLVMPTKEAKVRHRHLRKID